MTENEDARPDRDRYRLPIRRQLAIGTLFGLLIGGGIALSCSDTGRPDAAQLATSVSASVTQALESAQQPSGSEQPVPLLGAPSAKVASTTCTEPKGGDSTCSVKLEVTPLNPTAKPFTQNQSLALSVGTNGCWKATEPIDIPGPYGGPETLSGCVED